MWTAHRAGVELLGDAAPAEDPDPEERRLEGEQGLERERGTEDVPDEARVVGFIPNWNSCTMPVTSPSAKLMASKNL